MAAKYLVTVPPGAPVPKVGFVRPGEIFTAPEGMRYVPSKTFLPVNQEAQAELRKLGIEAPIVSVTATDDGPKIEEGITLQQLGEMNRRGESAAVPGSGTIDRKL